MRSTTDTLAWLRGQHESHSTAWTRLCLGLTRTARGLDGYYFSAYAAWLGAEDKHPLTPASDFHDVPRGAPIFYKGTPYNGIQYGHVVTYVGYTKAGPMCWTNDALVRGGVSMVSPLWFLSHWGETLLGWTGDLNRVDLHLDDPAKPPAEPPSKVVRLSLLITAARADADRDQGEGTPGSRVDVLIVERALAHLGHLPEHLIDGSFGSSTVDAYRRWQLYLGYTGADANGIPGPVSLHRLGARFGFRVFA